jgi:cytochrome P450
MTIFTILAAHPVIQARLQAEMDIAIGRDRLPNFSDVENLPYMRCVISEVIRRVAVIIIDYTGI